MRTWWLKSKVNMNVNLQHKVIKNSDDDSNNSNNFEWIVKKSSFPASAISLMLQENREKSMKQYADNYDKIRSPLFFRHFSFPTIYFSLFFNATFPSLFHRTVCVCVTMKHTTYHKWIRTIKWMDEWNASAFFLRLGSLFFIRLHILLLCNLFGPVSLFVPLFFHIILYLSI